MRILKPAALAFLLLAGGIGPFAASPAQAQDLIDRGFVHGWNLMVDPSFGNGCLIQTVYEDLSVVRLGYDVANNRGYFVVFNQAWGDIETGKQYAIAFELDGKRFDATATGLKQGRAPGAVVFFTDRNFVHAIAEKQHMTVFGQSGQTVMRIDLSGTAKALEYARSCQDELGWGG